MVGEKTFDLDELGLIASWLDIPIATLLDATDKAA